MPPAESRREFVQRLVSASAAIVAICALAVSVYQAKITREQQKLGAWPRVALANRGGDDRYEFLVQNVGVGPALVRSVTLLADRRRLHTWDDVLTTAMARDSTRLDPRTAHANITTNSVDRGMVLLPASTTELIRVRGPLAAPIRHFFNDEHTRLSVCYCSVYRDCWVSDSRTDEPTEVRACPDEPGREFKS